MSVKYLFLFVCIISFGMPFHLNVFCLHCLHSISLENENEEPVGLKTADFPVWGRQDLTRGAVNPLWDVR